MFLLLFVTTVGGKTDIPLHFGVRYSAAMRQPLPIVQSRRLLGRISGTRGNRAGALTDHSVIPSRWYLGSTHHIRYAQTASSNARLNLLKVANIMKSHLVFPRHRSLDLITLYAWLRRQSSNVASES